ncbi:hypothetical protein JHW43_005367 [Diplocarpon mali]|nr:hypothetical protein JHW43_005367 [Diplocarpon mali]
MPKLQQGLEGPQEKITPPDTFRLNSLLQTPAPLTQSQRWTACISSNIERITYSFLFTCVGLPIHHATGYAMPAQQTLAVIAYFVALGLPSRWKQFLHLMLVSPALTVQGVYMLGAIRGNNLTVSLHSYRTGASCLDLWHSKPNLKVPGAGDILGF